MAQELDLIFETLREIKRINTANSESFERLLISIANKLELMDRNSASADLIKSYLTDMVQSTDSKYNTTLEKFSDIEKALKAIFQEQDEHVKTKEIKELFDAFTSNLNSVYSEIRQQKALVASAESKISEIASNKSDKEDIQRTISLLRNDFENINQSYKYTIDAVSTDLKSIINGIMQTDQTTINTQIKEQVNIIQKSTSDIVNFLSKSDKHNEQLEHLLANVATNEQLKYAQSIIDSIMNKSEEIYIKLSDRAEKSDINDILAETDIIKQKLDESVTKSLFNGIMETANQIIEQSDNLNRQLAVITKNIDKIPDTSFLEEYIENLYKKLSIIEEGINKIDSRPLLDEVRHNVRKIVSELNTEKTIVSDILDVVSNKVLTSIDEINFENESYDIKNHVSEMVKLLPQKEDIERILDSYKDTKQTLETVIAQTDKILDKFDNLPTHADMDALNSNQLGLVENLQEVADKSDVQNISSKLDKVESEVKNVNFDKEFESIYDKTSSIENWLSNSNIKENADEIVSEIRKKPNKEELYKILETMETVINCVEELSQNADAKKVKNTMADVYRLIEELKEDFISTAEMHNDSVIVNLSELQRSVENIVSGDEFGDFIDELKDFLQKVTSSQEKTSDEYKAIKEYQEAVLIQLESINTDVIKDILGVRDDLTEVKAKVSSIQDWLTNSKLKENTDVLISQMQEKPDRDDILKVLKVVETIVGDLSNLTVGDSSISVSNTITGVCQQLEDLKAEFIATSAKQNDSVVEHLSEIQEAVENIVHGEDFTSFTDEVKQLLEVIVSNTDKINSDYIAIKEYQVAILDKLNAIDPQTIKEIVESRSHVVEDTLTTISEYLTTVNQIDTNEIKSSVAEIKKILESKQDAFEEFESNSQETIDILENYLTEIKRILDLSDFAVAENVKNKLIKIEEDLLLYQGQNENALTDIIAKLNEYQEYTKTLDEPFSNQDLKESMLDIAEIKDMITTLAESYRSLKYDEESKEKTLAEFVSERLDDLGEGLEELSNGIETQLQQGFAYHAALIEEKTASLLEFIQDLRHNNSENIDLYERLTVTDSKLMDYKQELELINTDVISAINSKSDKLIEEFEPIKLMLINLCENTKFTKKIGEDLNELHDSMAEDFSVESAVSKATLSHLDYTYNQLANDLTSIEENIKSVVMTDIDSVMRKIDDLQAVVEKTVSNIEPPEASSMAEFREFIDKIDEFKNSQKQMIQDAAEDIKQKMDAQHEEIKSILTVSYNNDKIIQAIEDLKASILDKAVNIQQIQASSDAIDDELSEQDLEDSDFDDDTEKEFKQETISFSDLQSKNDDASNFTRQILAEVRSDYNKFAEIVSQLSGDNAQIKDILNVIQDKMDNIVVKHVSASGEDVSVIETGSTAKTDSLPSLDDEPKKDVILGKNNFNFIQALDCFKSDVKNLHETVDSVLSPEECEQAVTSGQIANIDPQALSAITSKLDKIQRRINSGEWLEEIKSYISNGKIGTTLELILGKLDILALTDSCEWVQDVKELVGKLKEGEMSASLDPQIGQMLQVLNDKVDILAQSDDYELFEELREILENTGFEQNIETTNLLSLINQKLDVLAHADEDVDIDGLSDKLSLIEEKIDILALSEDDIVIEELSEKLSAIEEKISGLSITEDGALIDELNSKLSAIESKISQIAQTEENVVIDGLSGKLSSIEAKINSLSQPDDDIDIEELTEKLALIEEKIDILATSGDDNDSPGFVDDMMYTLMNLEDKIDKFAKLSGDKQSEEIHKTFERLSEKLDDLTNNGSVSEDVKNKLGLIESKIDVIASSSDEEWSVILEDKLNILEEKIDILALSDTEGEVAELRETIEELRDGISNSTDSKIFEEFSLKLKQLSEKINLDEVSQKLDQLGEKVDLDKVSQKLDLLDAKVDIVAANETYNDLEDIKLSLENVEEKVAAVKKYSESDVKITAILEVINHKIDTLAQHGNDYNQKEFRDIKDLIMAQMDYIDSLESNQKTEAVRKCLKELTIEVNNLNTDKNTKQIQKTIRDMKESIMAAVVSVFDQVSFIEESEDIKDFVEEKTDEINQNLATVTNQLKQLTTGEDAADYTYSMQDIESDLAKLRLALNELQINEQENQAARLTSLLDNINQIGTSVNDLQNSIPKEELLGMQLKFDQINSDIESLTGLSNQLLAASGETYHSLNTNLETFGRKITEQLTTKVDKVTKLLEHSHASDAVMRQALIYVGEWIDSASDSMNKISTNSEEIIEVKTAINTLKQSLPEQTNILSSLEEKFDEQQERLAFFERQITRLLCIEEKFEEQQERIDRLEMTIEKILSAVEDIDDTKVNRKIDKIDKQIAKLSINIEKLASYVD